MKVLFDHQIFSYQTYGGASRYYVELINEFNKLEDIHVDIGLKYSKNEYLKRSSFFQVKDLFGKFKLPGNSQMIQFFISYLINKNISQKKLYEKKYDIFHPTFYDPYFFKDLKGKPFVLTILDMIPENFPELFPVNSLYSKYVTGKWIAAKKTLAEKADKIIAIALAFVFPSIYEGFEIPIIEAFSCGYPVILSNSSSFPEVALDGALYFNCNEKDDILNKVERVIYNSKVREELIAKGFERARFFTWKKTALETKELYKEVI